VGPHTVGDQSRALGRWLFIAPLGAAAEGEPAAGLHVSAGRQAGHAAVSQASGTNKCTGFVIVTHHVLTVLCLSSKCHHGRRLATTRQSGTLDLRSPAARLRFSESVKPVIFHACFILLSYNKLEFNVLRSILYNYSHVINIIIQK